MELLYTRYEVRDVLFGFVRVDHSFIYIYLDSGGNIHSSWQDKQL